MLMGMKWFWYRHSGDSAKKRDLQHLLTVVNVKLGLASLTKNLNAAYSRERSVKLQKNDGIRNLLMKA
jgi:hypothetical protein